MQFCFILKFFEVGILDTFIWTSLKACST